MKPYLKHSATFEPSANVRFSAKYIVGLWPSATVPVSVMSVLVAARFAYIRLFSPRFLGEYSITIYQNQETDRR